MAVRTFAEKGSGPLAEVEDMVAKTHRDGPFRKFRGRPQGKVAISSCGWPWNSYDIARGLYRILRIARLLFILLLFVYYLLLLKIWYNVDESGGSGHGLFS